MTSALRGEGELAQKQTIVLMGCSSVSEKGGGPKVPNFCGCHMWTAPYQSSFLLQYWFLAIQDPMTELYKSINSSSAKHKIIHQLIYSEKHFTSFNTILSGYLDKDTDVLMETNAPRTWFLFTVPFVATVVRHHLCIYDVRKFFTIINPPILALILNILFLEKYTFTWGEASLVFLLYPSIQESSKNAQNSHSWANLKHCPRMSVGKATIRPEHIWLKSMPYWWIWSKKFENITRVLEDSIVKVVWTCISASQGLVKGLCRGLRLASLHYITPQS